MNQNNIEALLGAVVLAVAIIFLVFGTGQANNGPDNGHYIVKAQFTDIGGLAEGDDIKISGVIVGRVKSIGLDPVLYTADVTMAVDESVQLPTDTAARITSEGLLGGSYLALDVGADEEMLDKGDRISITQSAQNLEQLLGQFIFSLQDTKNE